MRTIFAFSFSRMSIDSQNLQKYSTAKICTHKVLDTHSSGQMYVHDAHELGTKWTVRTYICIEARILNGVLTYQENDTAEKNQFHEELDSYNTDVLYITHYMRYSTLSGPVQD